MNKKPIFYYYNIGSPSGSRSHLSALKERRTQPLFYGAKMVGILGI